MRDDLQNALTALLGSVISSFSEILRLLLNLIAGIKGQIAEIEPSEATALWIQIAVGLLTILWILFQFAWLRRLNEARLERHLEGTIGTERENLADERTYTFASFDRAKRMRGIKRVAYLGLARGKLFISRLLWLLSFGTTKGLADHNMLLLQVGLEKRARYIYSEIARDAVKKKKLYEEAIKNKVLEAQNALIFAGRVALIENRKSAAVTFFKKARSLQQDADACLLIGRQFALANDYDGAMSEFDDALKIENIPPTTKSDVLRAKAELFIVNNRIGLARQQLSQALKIDKAGKHYIGLGRTFHLLGGLTARYPGQVKAAKKYYGRAAMNFTHANMLTEARASRQEAARLGSSQRVLPDGIFVRWLDRLARALAKQAAQLRARAQMRAT